MAGANSSGVTTSGANAVDLRLRLIECLTRDGPLDRADNSVLQLPFLQDPTFSLCIDVIATCCVAAVGMLGNAASVAVLRHNDRTRSGGAAHSPTSLLLRALAVCDVLFLALTVLRNYGHNYYVYGHNDAASYDAKLAHSLASANIYVIPLQQVALYASALAVALVTFERHRAVCRPYAAPPSAMRTRIAIVGVVAFAAAFYMPTIFAYEVAHSCAVELDGTRRLIRVVDLYYLRKVESVANNNYYQVVYSIVLEVLLRDLATTVVIVVFNGRLVCGMRLVRRRLEPDRGLQSLRQRQASSATAVQAGEAGAVTPTAKTIPRCSISRSSSGNSSDELTQTVTIVVTATVLFTLPATVFKLVEAGAILAKSMEAQRSTPAWGEYAPSLCNLVLTMGASVNFFIYVFCAKKFRAVLMKSLPWLCVDQPSNRLHSFTDTTQPVSLQKCSELRNGRARQQGDADSSQSELETARHCHSNEARELSSTT